MTERITVPRELLRQAIAAMTVRGPEWVVAERKAVCALKSALEQPAVEPVAKPMTAHRAAFFMERFKKEEKLLGPNEQAAVDFVIDMLAAPQAQQPAVEPLTTEEYTDLAHRIASDYRYGSTPQHIAYTFLPHTLEQFVRAIEQAVRRKAGLK